MCYFYCPQIRYGRFGRNETMESDSETLLRQWGHVEKHPMGEAEKKRRKRKRKEKKTLKVKEKQRNEGEEKKQKKRKQEEKRGALLF